MKTAYLLVHGAWQGAWAWQPVRERLEKQGKYVCTFDLPGSGQDTTPIAQVSLQRYVDSVITKAAALKDDGYSVILVGHSMGGAVITQAASSHHELFSKLIYVCAFLPADGQSVGMLAEQSKTLGAPGPNVILNEEKNAAILVADSIPEVFFNDSNPEIYSPILHAFRPQPIAPIQTKLMVGEQFAPLEKEYILCTRDNAVSPDLQRKMANKAGIKTMHTLDSGHEPFFSCPDSLTALLVNADLNRE